MTILVTGAAGFIGFHVAARLMADGHDVLGIDSLNAYYPVQLKQDRIARLQADYAQAFRFAEVDFADHAALDRAVAGTTLTGIVHLGAQAGVRYSLENPRAYVQSNLVGQLNMLELARHSGGIPMVYASSSSVYGGNETLPFRVEDRADRPMSLYAATKRSDELLSESYAHLYRIPLTGLRFFTVYGPWGRPDMALWLFTAAILEGRPIDVFNDGAMRRDFTYIDDIVDGVVACLAHPAPDDGREKPGGSRAPHRLYNIGNNRSEELGRLIALIETACGRPAIRNLRPMQPGDVKDTFADITAIQHDLGFTPRTTIDEGVPKFVDWYRGYTGMSLSDPPLPTS